MSGYRPGTGTGGSGSGIAASFETVSKNLDAANAQFDYTGDVLTAITYQNGVVKTFDYDAGVLIGVTLSGATPGGIALTKTLAYAGGDLDTITYS